MEKELEKIIREFHLVEQIQKILSLEKDWDDEGDKGYAGKEDFVYSTIKYLPIITKLIKDKQGIKLDSKILHVAPGPEGSIDFCWRTSDYNLLLNVSENSEPSYAMTGKNNETLIKGKIH